MADSSFAATIFFSTRAGDVCLDLVVGSVALFDVGWVAGSELVAGSSVSVWCLRVGKQRRFSQQRLFSGGMLVRLRGGEVKVLLSSRQFYAGMGSLSFA